MKLAYERPVMRAQQFQTNAYCESCMRVPNGVKEDNYIKVTLRGDEDAATYGQTLWFSAVAVPTINQNTGAAQYYYHEHESYKDTGYQANGMYFLEFSAGRTEQYGKDTFYVYKDMADSVEYTPNIYITDPDRGFKSGVGSLQVNGGWSDHAWSSHDGGGWYKSDSSVTHGDFAEVQAGTNYEYLYTASW